MKKFLFITLVLVIFGGVIILATILLQEKREVSKKEPVAFETITQSTGLPWLVIDSEKTSVTKKIFRDEESWKKFLLQVEKAAEQKKITPFKIPSINFDKEMVIGVFSYVSNRDLKIYVSSVEKVTMKKTTEKSQSQKLIISIIKELSGKPEIPSVFYSYHLIKFKKTGLPVEFIISTQTKR